MVRLRPNRDAEGGEGLAVLVVRGAREVRCVAHLRHLRMDHRPDRNKSRLMNYADKYRTCSSKCSNCATRFRRAGFVGALVDRVGPADADCRARLRVSHPRTVAELRS